MDTKYKKIYKYLLSCGFSPVHKGFKLIIDAVIVISEKAKHLSLSEIYLNLSKNYNISADSVQKNIKNAIDYASLNCNIDFFTEEFGALTKNGGLTCGVFLCYVADKINYGNIKNII